MNNASNPPLIIDSVKEVISPAAGAAVRLKVDAMVNGQRSGMEIAISTELAPRVALALLEKAHEARAQRDDLAPALEPVAIGVVSASDAETIRLHMLFQEGAVLPVEVKADAAELLKMALQRELGESPATNVAAES